MIAPSSFGTDTVQERLPLVASRSHPEEDPGRILGGFWVSCGLCHGQRRPTADAGQERPPDMNSVRVSSPSATRRPASVADAAPTGHDGRRQSMTDRLSHGKCRSSLTRSGWLTDY